MNKDVFSGFIQGVVAMYKQNSFRADQNDD